MYINIINSYISFNWILLKVNHLLMHVNKQTNKYIYYVINQFIPVLTKLLILYVFFSLPPPPTGVQTPLVPNQWTEHSLHTNYFSSRYKMFPVCLQTNKHFPVCLQTHNFPVFTDKTSQESTLKMDRSELP